jgi:uncharacterized membrane protein HdeD (DUF308 family)
MKDSANHHRPCGRMHPLARTWWAVGLRSSAAILFGLTLVVLLPSSTTASLVMLFAAYVAADGFFAILAATRMPRR